jgi:hypothetical protein
MAQSVGTNGQNDRTDVKTVQILLNFHAGGLGLQVPLAEEGGIGPKTLALGHPSLRLECVTIRITQRQDALEQFPGIERTNKSLTYLLTDLLQARHFLRRDCDRFDASGSL